MFTEWNDDFRKGTTRKVVVDLTLAELQCLLDGTAKCRQILVTRQVIIVFPVCFFPLPLIWILEL